MTRAEAMNKARNELAGAVPCVICHGELYHDSNCARVQARARSIMAWKPELVKR